MCTYYNVSMSIQWFIIIFQVDMQFNDIIKMSEK